MPAAELMNATLAWAQALAARAPLSLRCARQAVAQASEADLEQTISAEADLQAICLASEDAGEGARGFLDKRAPVWKGC